MQKPVCSVCESQGVKYQIRSSGGGTRTKVANIPYWDEDGVYHHHDSNKATHKYKCSNGHLIERVQYGKDCPNPECDYKARMTERNLP